MKCYSVNLWKAPGAATSAKYYAMLYRESDFDYSRIQAEDAKRYKGYARQAREDARRYNQMFPEVFGR